jgi:hypothetical protein
MKSGIAGYWSPQKILRRRPPGRIENFLKNPLVGGKRFASFRVPQPSGAAKAVARKAVSEES